MKESFVSRLPGVSRSGHPLGQIDLLETKYALWSPGCLDAPVEAAAASPPPAATRRQTARARSRVAEHSSVPHSSATCVLIEDVVGLLKPLVQDSLVADGVGGSVLSRLKAALQGRCTDRHTLVTYGPGGLYFLQIFIELLGKVPDEPAFDTACRCFVRSLMSGGSDSVQALLKTAASFFLDDPNQVDSLQVDWSILAPQPSVASPTPVRASRPSAAPPPSVPGEVSFQLKLLPFSNLDSFV